MSDKLNKDGLIGGQLIDHKTHNQILIKKRQAAKLKLEAKPKKA